MSELICIMILLNTCCRRYIHYYCLELSSIQIVVEDVSYSLRKEGPM